REVAAERGAGRWRGGRRRGRREVGQAASLRIGMASLRLGESRRGMRAERAFAADRGGTVQGTAQPERTLGRAGGDGLDLSRRSHARLAASGAGTAYVRGAKRRLLREHARPASGWAVCAA